MPPEPLPESGLSRAPISLARAPPVGYDPGGGGGFHTAGGSVDCALIFALCGGGDKGAFPVPAAGLTAGLGLSKADLWRMNWTS